jgi:acyl-CoA thioesterase-2
MKSQHQLHADVALHQAALAYASDYHFLGTALQAHPIKPNDKGIRMATIDHAMWFHQPIDFNQWHVYNTVSPFTGNSRGLVQGQFFAQDNTLVATTMQEGMIRLSQHK